MLTSKQIKEIREHLEKAQNPIFFFDNDPDGLCSFLLLQRWIGRGKGIAIRSFPELDENYFKRINELNADYIFVLDKHSSSEGFVKRCNEINIPVVWIDHHLIPDENKELLENFNYYNPQYNKGEYNSDLPVTRLCYQVTNNEKDDWICIVGCVFDKYFPKEIYETFKKKYPELSFSSRENNSVGADEISYDSDIGKISRMFSFALKDSTTKVVRMMKYLMSVKSPEEVLKENPKNKSIHSRYKEINEKYKRILEKGKSIGNSLNENERILFLKYSGDLSISSDLSSELQYLFPGKIIVVAFVTGVKVNISFRGNKIKTSVLNVINEFEGATGGGHENAVGSSIQLKDLEEFKERLKKEFE